MPKNKKIKDFNFKKWPSKKFRPIILLVVISLIIASLLPWLWNVWNYKNNEVAVSTIIQNHKNELYESILIDNNKATALLKDSVVVEWGQEKKVREVSILPKWYSLSDLWLNKPIDWTKVIIKDNSSKEAFKNALPTILMIVIFIIIAFVLVWRMWWMANNAMSFSKSRAKFYDPKKQKVLFSDIAWAEEEKVELKEIVDFLKSPKKYKKMWAKIPRWTLLVWPPGTWKTMIARAVAGEAWVPFMSISGSEFVEMFVWVWASRVRDLFEQAKKNAPSIIFIDEIDAIWKKRWPWIWGWHDEREQTLNQILTEMDGFEQETDVIVMWATNRSDVLDKALLRPWRFDRKVLINMPTLEDRKEILGIHFKDKPISKKIDIDSTASATVWFSWADLWNLANESAILAARYNQKEITQANIQEALEKKIIGLTKKSAKKNEEEVKIVSYHEVWHAIVWHFLEHCDPVHKISIVWRGSTWWVTWFLPERDKYLVSKAKFKHELASLYGWRVAEEVFFGEENITTWASNDIERATEIARSMITKYGFDEELWAENFAWNALDWNHLWANWEWKVYSQKTQEKIDEKTRLILKEAYDLAKKLILENKDLHDKIAKDLLEKEEVSRDEFEAYFA